MATQVEVWDETTNRGSGLGGGGKGFEVRGSVLRSWIGPRAEARPALVPSPDDRRPGSARIKAAQRFGRYGPRACPRGRQAQSPAPVCSESHPTSSAGAVGLQSLMVSLFPLVKRIAAKMRARLPASVDVDDLVGAGVLGLVDAVRKYDLSKRVKLETYARYRIRGSILDSLRALDPASRTLRRKKRRIDQLYSDLANRLGRHPSDEEMAKLLGVDLGSWNGILEELQAAGSGMELERRLASRCARAGSEETAIPDAQPDPFELFARQEQRDLLNRALAWLPERARLVLTLYYRDELTMLQIAARLGVDESRISQIHSEALARLRRSMQMLLTRPPAGRVGNPLPGWRPQGMPDLGLIPGSRGDSLSGTDSRLPWISPS